MNAKTALFISIVAMAIIIVASNILVAIPINDWLTWGTLTFPFAFLVTDLMNRYFGAHKARQLVYAGFAIGVVASLAIGVYQAWGQPGVPLLELTGIRIALASGFAFLISQLLDVSVFDKLRQKQWWVAPFTSSFISTIFDTFLFYSFAFVATGLPWPQWAIGDLGVKWVVALVALIPYALFTARSKAATA